MVLLTPTAERKMVLTSFKEDWLESEARARELAEKFDLIISWRSDFIPAMKDTNPSVIVLRYIPICVIYSNQAEWDQAVAEKWLLKDQSGNYVYLTKWPTAHLCDPANSKYRNWLANVYCKQRMAEGYDGLFGDGASSIIEPTYHISGKVVNPATGKLYTANEWVDALIGLNQAIKSAVGNAPHIGNGLMNSKMFYSYPEGPENYKKLLNTLDGAMIEYAVMSPGEGRWRSEETWISDVNFIAWHTKQGKITLPWSINTQVGSLEQVASFIFASYLLGVKDFSRTYAGLKEGVDPHVIDLLKNDMGEPIGDYYQIAGTHVYERDFTKVKVLVNPTGTPYTIQVAGEEPRTIDPHTGIIISRPKL